MPLHLFDYIMEKDGSELDVWLQKIVIAEEPTCNNLKLHV